MNNEISTTGWIAIAFMAVLVIAINVSLFSFLQNRRQPPPSSKKMGKNPIDIIKDPWGEEDDQWAKLNRSVQNLKSPGSDSSQNPGQDN